MSDFVLSSDFVLQFRSHFPYAPNGQKNVVKDSSLPEEHSGSVSGHSFAIVVSRYHHAITGKLLEGALETLARHEVPDDQIRVVWAPGAWELPIVAQTLLRSNVKYGAVLCFGCVIRGETTHDQYINATVSHSLGELSLGNNVPIGFGLLTCNTMEQAVARAGGDVGNKGVETATAAIETRKLMDSIVAGN
ncbi:6,7-dimethyl-8-ribityllumazine synthase [Mariniblastus sp.]|nr:6,7-dimethyl-8-ribityllumazine synthase [Mariniblastus sp.]